MGELLSGILIIPQSAWYTNLGLPGRAVVRHMTTCWSYGVPLICVAERALCQYAQSGFVYILNDPCLNCRSES